MAVQDPRWLQEGDRGEDVRALQQAANVWLLYQATVGVSTCNGLTRPALLDEDGIFGPRTRAAVEWLQCRFMLVQDGIAGPRTLEALGRHLARQGFGQLMFGQETGVLPVRYFASDAANALRQEHGLPPIEPPGEPPAQEQPAPPTAPRWLPWAVLAAGVVAFVRRRRGR